MLNYFVQIDHIAVEKLIHELPIGYRSLGCLAITTIIRYIYDGEKLKQVMCAIFGRITHMNVQRVYIMCGHV